MHTYKQVYHISLPHSALNSHVSFKIIFSDYSQLLSTTLIAKRPYVIMNMAGDPLNASVQKFTAQDLLQWILMAYWYDKHKAHHLLYDKGQDGLANICNRYSWISPLTPAIELIRITEGSSYMVGVGLVPSTDQPLTYQQCGPITISSSCCAALTIISGS